MLNLLDTREVKLLISTFFRAESIASAFISVPVILQLFFLAPNKQYIVVAPVPASMNQI